jgi:RNA polymerase sigma-70 factor (ECF subfamily)
MITASPGMHPHERIVPEVGGRLLQVARRILRDEEDARDAVQDGLVSALGALDTFRDGARLSTWLHRIVVNAALMKLRARRRRPETPIESLLPVFDAITQRPAAPVAAWPESAEAALQRREIRLLVHRCIDRLPEAHRAVLRLRDIDDLDTVEVAAALGLTPNAVKIRLHRARQALRTLLAPHMTPAAAPPPRRPAAPASA